MRLIDARVSEIVESKYNPSVRTDRKNKVNKTINS